MGYEHQNRKNERGMRSLLRQGAKKLSTFTRRAGVQELRERALSDAERGIPVAPPKLMLTIAGIDATAPKGAIRIEIPRRIGSGGGAR